MFTTLRLCSVRRRSPQAGRDPSTTTWVSGQGLTTRGLGNEADAVEARGRICGAGIKGVGGNGAGCGGENHRADVEEAVSGITIGPGTARLQYVRPAADGVPGDADIVAGADDAGDLKCERQ